MRRAKHIGLLCAAGLALLAPSASATIPEGAEWRDAYFMSGDGLTRLHADVIRPAGLKDTDKTPVILSVGPYFNHSGVDPADGAHQRRAQHTLGRPVHRGQHLQARLHARAGRPAWLRRERRVQRLRRRRRADGREGGRRVGRRPALVDGQGRAVGQELRRLDRGDGTGDQAQGPGCRRDPVADHRRLPDALHERRPLRLRLVRDAGHLPGASTRNRRASSTPPSTSPARRWASTPPATP